MKKITATVTIGAAVLFGSLTAQANVLSSGDNLVGATVGFGFSVWNNAPTFSASYERGMIDEVFPDFNLGVGALGSYTSFDSGFDYSVSLTTIGAQAVLHYDTGDDSFLPYGGITLGFNTLNYSDDDVSTSYGSGLTTGGLVGTRYYFADDLAANLRLSSNTGSGFGYSVFSVGVDYAF